LPEKEVRKKYATAKQLGGIKSKERGWTLDVLNAIRSLGKVEFSNDDAYSLVAHLEKLHPDNRHVRDKIRQQLQVLRDLGFLLHVERGCWRLP
jgi:type II restriction enzyme